MSNPSSSLVTSPSSFNPTKHFVWGWGRLTPSPLLLTPSTATLVPRKSASIFARSNSTNNDAVSNEQESEAVKSAIEAEVYPFPSSTSQAGSQCTLSPTLIEAMESAAVRAIHTAAYHTVAVTHSGSLYSWNHNGIAEQGPAIEVDVEEFRAVAGKAPHEAKLELARLRAGGAPSNNSGIAPSSSSAAFNKSTVTYVPKNRSSPSSRSDSPVNNSSASAIRSMQSRPLIGSSGTVPEKKFRKVIVGQASAGKISMAASSSVPSISAAALGRSQMLAVTTAGQVLQWDWSSSDSVTASTTLPPPSLNGSPLPASQLQKSIAPSSPHGSSSSLATTSSNSTSSHTFTTPPRPSSSATALTLGSPLSNPAAVSLGTIPTVLTLPPFTSGMGPTLVNGLACGGQFHLLATAEGVAYSWGKLGTHGRLGQGIPLHTNSNIASSTTSVASIDSPPVTPDKTHPSSLSNLLSVSGGRTPRSDSPTMEKHSVSQPRALQLSPPGALVSKVAAGWAHGCLVTAAGAIYSFGCGLNGRLGSGNQLDEWLPQPVLAGGLESTQIVEVTCGYHHTLAVDVNGKVWVWGGNEHGQLGLGDRTPRGTPEYLNSFVDEVVAVAAGAFHSAIVTAVGDLYTFGYGKSGQLGFGDTKSHASPRLVSSLNGMDVCLVACGGDYTIAVTDHFMQVQQDYFSSDGANATPFSPFLASGNAGGSLMVQTEEVELDRKYSNVSPPQLHNLPPNQLSPNNQQQASVKSARSASAAVASGVPSNSLRSASPLPTVGSVGAYSFSTSTSFSNGNSSSLLLPPPTPVIFEEEVVSSSTHPSTLSTATPGENEEVSEPVEEVEERGPRIRMSASSNALADLVNHHGASTPGEFRRSSSFGRTSEATNGVVSVSTTASSKESGHLTPRGAARASSTGETGTPASMSQSSPSSSVSGMSSANQKKTIFQLVKESFSFPQLVIPDIKNYLPTVRPRSSSDPIEESDSSSPPPPIQSLNSSVATGSSSSTSSSANTSTSSGKSKDTDETLSSLSLLPDFRPSTSSQRKSVAEVAKHRDDLARMNHAYKAKLRREAKGKALLREQEQLRRKEAESKSKEIARKNLEREQRLDEAADIWLKQIVPNWGASWKTKKTRDLVARIGVPPRVRCVVWPLALGNALMITPELYEIFGAQAMRARKQRLAELKALNNAPVTQSPSREYFSNANMTSVMSPASVAAPSLLASPSSSSSFLAPSQSFSLGNQGTFSYIDVDLTRTYPNLAFFQEECMMNDQLRHLLYTYVFYRPDVGYVQGMSYLAGNLLLYMPPYDAFVSFAHLLNSPFMHVFLKLETHKMEMRYKIFEELFQDTEPDLYRHFQVEQVTSELFFMEWCMTLFCKRLKLDVVGRVWDNYFIFGEVIVYRTAVGMLRALKNDLMSVPFDQIMKKLNATPLDLSEDDLVNAMADIKLSNALRNKLKMINPLLPEE